MRKIKWFSYRKSNNIAEKNDYTSEKTQKSNNEADKIRGLDISRINS